jgi:glycosyltransferase involved in cell wall biosynthesis
VKITVVLSAFERGDYLRLALLCLGHQARVPDEVVVTDDGSEEDIAAAVAESVKGLPLDRVKYVRQENRGFRLARNRNNGIRGSSGDYLVFWDQDVTATRGYLEVFSGHGQPGQFLVAFPVLLDRAQTALVRPEAVARGDYADLLTRAQVRSIHRQYVKDTFYYYAGRLMRGRGHRPKVRGGYFGISRHDLERVDGFDENYRGWGAEDDDLGRRLYRAGVVGRTAFRDEFPLHLWHPHSTGTADSPNLEYYNRRLAEIASGDYKAANGLSNPLDDDPVDIIQIK